MKVLILLILFSLVFELSAKDKIEKNTLEYIRKEFYAAVEDEMKTKQLIKFIITNFSDKVDTYPAQILSYAGGLEALMAKHVINPFKKFQYLLTALEKLDKAVELLPANLEVRFIRFSVLHNLPSVYKISDKRQEDMLMVISLLLKRDYSDISKELQKGLVEFLLKSERLTVSQEKEMNRLLYQISLNE